MKNVDLACSSTFFFLDLEFLEFQEELDVFGRIFCEVRGTELFQKTFTGDLGSDQPSLPRLREPWTGVALALPNFQEPKSRKEYLKKPILIGTF